MKAHTSLALLSGLWLLGCTPTPAIGSNRNPEDLSAGGHRHEATLHLEQAAQDARQAPSASRVDTATDVDTSADAAIQRREAQIHLNAAVTLERAMQTECAPIAPAERRQCGFGDRDIASVEDVQNGVRIRFATAEPGVRETQTRARCAHAYADFVGRAALPGCLVALRDLSISALSDQGAVTLVLTSTNQTVVPELRRRAHALVRRPSTGGRGY